MRILAIIAASMALSLQVLAGNLDPVAPPDDPASAMPTLQDVYDRLTTGTNAPLRSGGFAEPEGAPAPVMATLDDIMDAAPAPHENPAAPGQVRSGKVFWGLAIDGWGVATGTMPERVLAATSTILQAGYYPDATFADVETNLTSGNIRQGVPLFGVTGTAVFASPYPAPVPRTGANNSGFAGDDGHIRAGETWPTPRFTALAGAASNCVIDNLTGLMWLKNPAIFTVTNWQTAVNTIENLNGTQGRGGFTDWRLPNLREQLSLLEFGRARPALPVGHPFLLPSQIGIPFATGTRNVYGATPGFLFFCVGLLDDGSVVSRHENDPNNYKIYYWPVRGGVP